MNSVNRVEFRNAIHSKSVVDRFWKFVKKTESCWIWTGSKDQNGYGRLSVFGRGRSAVKAHRLSYCIHHDIDPLALNVCHKCDNPSCVNPDHLFLGTHLENMTDAKIEGRMKIASKGKSGPSNNSAKLNYEDVSTIRKMRSEGMTHQSIASIFNVHRTTISLIDRNINWKTTK